MPLLLVEALFALVGVAGVAAIFWPAALILAGFLGVVACERLAATPQLPAAPGDAQ